ncbi:MAG: hypothetical protein Q8K02_07580, partial [Flavobacterium sp.]|nr:hypothetical protein [Flavobacterium sp.]
MKNRLLFRKSKRLLFLCFVLLVLLSSNSISGQLAVWNPTWSGTSPSPFAATSLGSNVASGSLARVNLTGTSSGSRYSSSNWSASNYLTITITASPGFVLNLNSQVVSLTMGSSGTGPNLYTLRSNVDSYSSSLGSAVPSCSGHSLTNITLPSTGYNGLTSITFRIIGSTTGCSSTFGAGGTGGPSAITINGNAVSAVTSPTVSNASATLIATTTATLSGNVTNTGGAAITANGSVYALTSDDSTPTIGELNVTNLSTPVPGSGTGSFSNATGAVLMVNRQYSYNAYATNSVGTSYGTVATFYTLAVTPNAPTVGSPTVNSLTVTLDTSDDNPSGTQYAIQETGGDYVQADGTLGADAVWRTESEWGTVIVNGLASNIAYTFQVKARNGDGVETDFSATASGTTEANLNPTIEAGTLASFGSICVNSSVIESFTFTGYNLTNANVVVGPLSGFTFATSEEGTYQASLSFTPDVNGEVAETVFVQFTPTAEQNYDGFISITGGGASGVNVSVIASGINTAVVVTTGGSSSISATSAVLLGSFEEGCSTVTTSGVQYSLNVDFTGASSIALGGTAAALSPNTLYYYRAFATDATGTVYGAIEDFTTLNLAAPVALDGDEETTTSFVANWEEVNGAS